MQDKIDKHRNRWCLGQCDNSLSNNIHNSNPIHSFGNTLCTVDFWVLSLKNSSKNFWNQPALISVTNNQVWRKHIIATVRLFVIVNSFEILKWAITNGGYIQMFDCVTAEPTLTACFSLLNARCQIKKSYFTNDQFCARYFLYLAFLLSRSRRFGHLQFSNDGLDAETSRTPQKEYYEQKTLCIKIVISEGHCRFNSKLQIFFYFLISNFISAVIDEVVLQEFRS